MINLCSAILILLWARNEISRVTASESCCSFEDEINHDDHVDGMTEGYESVESYYESTVLQTTSVKIEEIVTVTEVQLHVVGENKTTTRRSCDGVNRVTSVYERAHDIDMRYVQDSITSMWRIIFSLIFVLILITFLISYVYSLIKKNNIKKDTANRNENNQKIRNIAEVPTAKTFIMSERIIISVNEGKIRGIKETSTYSGVEFFSFYGVRYGQPPIKNLRFKDPQPVKPWKGHYDATIKKPGCVQFSLRSYIFLGNEDCLYNNIHIPRLPVKGEPLKSVIINIHPGGFMFGTPNSDDYGSPHFVMHHDVVYVNIGHRLHILGYLNLGIKECSGNQALKDTILSLQWIKSNIRAFGGDPENITLLGSSSGGTLIHALMISPTIKDAGLFHKAIMMGAYLFLPVLPLEETNHHRAYEIAEMLGYNEHIEDKKALLMFLKRKQAEVLIECQRNCAKKFQEKIAPLYPIGVFNITFDRGDVFPESPITMMHSVCRIPLMIGFCEYESMMGFSKGLRRYTEEKFFTSVRQNCWGWGRNLTDEDTDYIQRRIKSFYTEGKSIEDTPLSLQADIQTDIILSDLYDSLVDIISGDLPSSVFVYKFNFEGDILTTKSLLKHNYDEELPGTYHACDFSYWNHFNIPGDEVTQQFVDYFTKFITNFAKTGNPNSEDIPIEWKPTTPDKPCYLRINDPLSMVNGKLNNDRLELWQDIKKHLLNK